MPDSVFSAEPVREFAGCSLHPFAADRFFELLFHRIARGSSRRPLLVGAHNLYSLYLYRRNAAMAEFFESCELCYVDGQAVLWLLTLAGCDTRRAHRFSLMDCLPDWLDRAQDRGLRVYYLGGSVAAVERGEDWIRRGWPELSMRLHHGYFQDSDRVVDAINEFEPDLLLVGMGMPMQEAWIVEQRGRLRAGAILQAGGTLDYYTGLQARPPARWSRLGMAWLYRLLHDPKRLWRRYLLTPWALIGPAYRLRRSLASGPGNN